MINLLAEILQFFSVITLGLLVGALYAEGGLLVPYWRTLPADKFFVWYQENGPRLYRFFTPITVAATLLAIAAAVACLVVSHPGRWAALSASLLSVFMIVLFFLYFEQANAKFTAAPMSAEELSVELARWATWHWARVLVGVLAFGVALMGFSKSL